MALSRMELAVQMARESALKNKRTLICVATRERAVAVREQFGLVNHNLIHVVMIDPPLHSSEVREVTFATFEDVRSIPVVLREDDDAAGQ